MVSLNFAKATQNCIYLSMAALGRNYLTKFSQPIRKALKTPEFVLSEAIYCRTKKSFEAPDRFTRRSAHLRQKRFVPDNTCFVDANFLQNCSLGMQKQDGSEQVKGKVKCHLQETIISDETAQDEEALWKKLLPHLLVTFYIYTDEFG